MPPATAGGSCGCTTDGRRASHVFRSRPCRPAAPAAVLAPGGGAAARPGPPGADRGRGLHRRPPAPVRHRPPRRPARGRRGARRAHPARDRAAPSAQRLGAARLGRPRAGGVGHVLRGRRRQAGRGRGRALPRGHRAGGRRPGPRRRRVPHRDRAQPRRGPGPRAGPSGGSPSPGGRRHRPPEVSGDPFVHLHVASGYSMQYGANHPADLVARAADHGMTALALTDRDGLYGAVKFALACRAAGVRPIFGVDLAMAPAVDSAVPRPLARSLGGASRLSGPPARRVPARGGASVDPRLPRVTSLARDGEGWRSLCRLTSATHLRGTRGEPVSSLALAAEHAPGLIALLGPDSPVGRALAEGRADAAAATLDAWRSVFGPGRLAVELVHHRGQGDRARARAMLRFAAEQQVPVVLSNAVRYVDALDAPTADVLDASRRLVPLDLRHVDRRTAEGYLKSGKEMAQVAEDLVGPDRDAALRLLEGTARLAEQCVVDVRDDLGIGTVRYPELDVVTTPAEAGLGPSQGLRARCEAGAGPARDGPDRAGTGPA